MGVELLTPAAALVVLAAVVPVAAWLLAERRAGRVRDRLQLPAPRAQLHAPVAIAATIGLLALAAAQPVLSSRSAVTVRSDSEAIIVVDTSRSMLAAASAGGPTRYRRAAAAALRLRAALGDVPVGLASLTDRVLPNLMPTVDRADFAATLRDAMGVDRPPPGSRSARRASTFESLADFAAARFFRPSSRSRVAIVLTDGETRPFDARALRRALEQHRIHAVFVRFWASNEQIWLRGKPDRLYVPDPSSGPLLAQTAAEIGARAFDEGELAAAARAARAGLGTAKTRVTQRRLTAQPLAAYAALAALIPLLLLLWRRNIV